MRNLLFITLWVSCILMATQIMAQTNETEGNTWMIKYDFISLMGDGITSSMGVKLGVEIPLKNNQSFEFDAMYIFPCEACKVAYFRIQTEKTNGIMLTAEYRFYLLHRPAPMGGFHLGPQVFYTYTKADMLETPEKPSTTYHVYRNLVAAHAMVGYQAKMARRLYFDPSIGIGLRYISSWNDNKLEDGSDQYEFPYNKLYESGSQWFPSVTLNIKFAFKF